METKLSIPHFKEFISVVSGFVRDNAISFNVAEDEINKLVISANEITERMIEKFLPNDDTPIEITFKAEENKITLSFTNKGIPMSGKTSHFDLENPDEASYGVSYNLVKSLMDEVKLINNGLDGWLVIIEKNLPLSLSEITTISPETIIEMVQKSFNIVRATPEMAQKIVKLAYLTYRYSLFREYFYYAEKLAEEIEKENIFSYVAITEENEVVAHVTCFKVEGMHALEFGALMVAPEYRGQKGGNIVKDLVIEHTLAAKKYYGDNFVMFCEAVTGHVKSQIVGERDGFLPVGILPSFMDRFNFVGFDVSKQRESLLIAAKNDNQTRIDLYIPKEISEITENIFAQFGTDLNFHFCESENNICRDKTEIKATYLKLLSTEEIIVNVGRDFESVLRKTITAQNENRIITTYVKIPSWENLPQNFAEIMKANNLYFCGYFPYESGKWLLIYACPYRQKFQFDQVQLHNPVSKKIAEHIVESYKENNGCI